MWISVKFPKKEISNGVPIHIKFVGEFQFQIIRDFASYGVREDICLKQRKPDTSITLWPWHSFSTHVTKQYNLRMTRRRVFSCIIAHVTNRILFSSVFRSLPKWMDLPDRSLSATTRQSLLLCWPSSVWACLDSRWSRWRRSRGNSKEPMGEDWTTDLC